MVKTEAELNKIIKKYISALSKIFSLDRVYLFGSYVKKNPHKWSDIDLAIVSKDFEHMDPYIAMVLLSRIKNKVDTSIEALPFTPKDIDSANIGSIEYAVAKEGKVVWKRSK